MAIAADYELQHRRVYEFFNLLSSLGVCSPIERGQLDWKGLAEVSQTLETVYTEIEIASLDKTIDAVFKMDKSPSLGLIALRFNSLYLYLGVETLSMRRVALLFHDGHSDLKTLQRRMYLVLNFLEVISAVEHTKSVSEYRLLLKPTDIVKKALKKRHETSNESCPQLIDALLNHYGPEFLEQLRAGRRAAFTRLTKNAE
jgi:hypothetical protein